jgi:hypothetical protein
LDHGIRSIDANEREKEPQSIGQANKESNLREALVPMSAIEEEGQKVHARPVKLYVEFDQVADNQFENILLCGPAIKVFEGTVEI